MQAEPNQQEQIAILQKAMETHKRVEQLQEENDNLRRQIQDKQEVFERLSQLALSSASLLGSVDSSSPVTEMSSVKCLSKLEESSAVSAEDEKPEEDPVKLIVGKYLNHLLAKLVEFSEKNQEQIDIFALQEIEEEMAQLYQFGEEKQIIPPTKPTEGWKKNVAVHQALFEKLQSLINQKQ
ncbi:hypothetical protein TVAG_325540 [Trichomonas vaginalis G3]|uniref:Uncharacterized protein n=1 Tax=Trichomonas vaginalis (strain ATCC PRA-98 / G3) TaxID=412133 RepID=A2EWF5_TRIV3|nr:hypothetical protein TVAGG3_0876910 [Trichomonas vaginalis G3]EAY02982.1 hypothetical protein TVAG_325540 [Trichomonas vaginalis G3]KAI5501754.1 hypothetical protein TVAGG3_0876910 [Trichomonas vaginalis G3]|eukprot:XP_001315205.1 hypothetical protein [Trichomonas vaginalis G3]